MLIRPFRTSVQKYPGPSEFSAKTTLRMVAHEHEDSRAATSKTFIR